jgi:tetratricopeptide (TPR) repeat protein
MKNKRHTFNGLSRVTSILLLNGLFLQSCSTNITEYNGKHTNSKILAAKNIVDDVDLVKYITNHLEYENDPELTRQLRSVIDNTKTDKSAPTVCAAANAITLLVASKYPFSGQNLSNVSIRGANLRNGIFHYTDFTNADLTEVNLTNCFLNDAILLKADMKDIVLSIRPDLRGHIQRLSGNRDKVTSVCFSTNSKLLASCSRDQTVLIWDVATENLFQILMGHTSQINSIKFSHNSHLIASASIDHLIKIWDVNKGRLIKNIYGHEAGVTGVCFSKNSDFLVSSSIDKTLRVWQVDSGKQIFKLTDHTDVVREVSYSPNDELIASASGDGTIKIWEFPSCKLLTNIVAHTDQDEVLSISFSNDSSRIASSSYTSQIKIWEVKTGQLLQVLIGHTKSVNNIMYSPKSDFLASASSDKTVKIWDVNTGDINQTIIDLEDEATCVAFSYDGKLLAYAGENGIIKLRDFNKVDILQTYIGHTDEAAVCHSPNGEFMASNSCSDIKIWDRHNGRLLQTIGKEIPEFEREHLRSSVEIEMQLFTDICFSNDSSSIAAGVLKKLIKAHNVGTEKSIGFSGDEIGKNEINIWQVKTGELVKSIYLNMFEEQPKQVRFSHDDRCIFTSFVDGKVIKSWNRSTGKQIKALDNCNTILRFTYSLISNLIATANADNTISIWDAKSWNLLKIIGEPNVPHDNFNYLVPFMSAYSNRDGINDICFSSDDRFIAVALENSEIKLYHLEDGELYKTLKNKDVGVKYRGDYLDVKKICFSKDNKFLAAGTNYETIDIWNTSNWELFQVLMGHNKNVFDVSFAINSKSLASASHDKTIRLWGLVSDQNIGRQFFCLNKIIANCETQFSADNALLGEVINLSTINQRVFQERDVVLEKNFIKENDTNKDYKRNLTTYRDLVLDKLFSILFNKNLKKQNSQFKNVQQPERKNISSENLESLTIEANFNERPFLDRGNMISELKMIGIKLYFESQQLAHKQLIKLKHLQDFETNMDDELALSQSYVNSNRLTPEGIEFIPMEIEKLHHYNHPIAFKTRLDTFLLNKETFGFIESKLEEKNHHADLIKVGAKRAIASTYYNNAIDMKHDERYEEALALFNKAININIDYPEIHYRKALLLRSLSRNNEASEAFLEDIKAKNNDFAEFYLHEAKNFLSLGAIYEAMQAYDKAIEFNSEYYDAYYNKGILLSRLGKMKEAEFFSKKCIDINNMDSARKFLNTGDSLHALNKYEEAIEVYNKAIELTPSFLDVLYYNKGNSFRALQKNLEALECYDQAIKLSPKYYYAYGNKANALKSLGRDKEAIEVYNIAIKIAPDPDNIVMYHNLFALHFNLKNYAEACHIYTEVMQKGKNSLDSKSRLDEIVQTWAMLIRFVGHEAIIKSYEEAIERDPSNISNYLEKASILTTHNKNKEALEVYDQLLECDPMNLEAYYSKGSILTKLGDKQNAKDMYMKALSLVPNFSNWDPLRRANYFKGQSLFNEALESYDLAIAMNNNVCEAYLEKSKIFEKLNKSEDAIECCQKAIALKPDTMECHIRMVNILESSGKFSEAINFCDRILSIFANKNVNKVVVRHSKNEQDQYASLDNHIELLNPEYAEVFFLKGNCLTRIDEYKKAITAYAKAIELNPYNSNYYINMSIAYTGLHKPQEVLRLLDKAIEIDPLSYVANFNKAFTFYGLGRHEDALACYNLASALNPSSTQPYYGIIEIFNLLGKKEKILDVYDKLLNLEPENKDTIVRNKIALLSSLGRNEEALDLCNVLLDLNPDNIMTLQIKGDILDLLETEKKGQELKAIIMEEQEIYSNIIALQPSNADAYNNKANTFLKLNKFQEAIPILSRAISLNPNDAIYYYNRGYAFKGIGKLERAVLDFNKTIEIDKSYIRAHYQMGECFKSLKCKEEALHCFRSVIELDPENMEVHFEIIDILGQLTKYKEALNYCDEIIKPKASLLKTFLVIADNPALLEDESIYEAFNSEAEYRSRLKAFDPYGIAMDLKLILADLCSYKSNLLKKCYKNLRDNTELLETSFQIVELNPDLSHFIDKYNNLVALDKTEEALESYNKAIKLKRIYGSAIHNIAKIYNAKARVGWDESVIDFYDYFLAIKYYKELHSFSPYYEGLESKENFQYLEEEKEDLKSFFKKEKMMPFLLELEEAELEYEINRKRKSSLNVDISEELQ